MDLLQRIKALHPTIDRLLDISGSPGLSLGVLHRGVILHTAHFGRQDVNHPAPPTDDTIYNIASFVKLLTAGTVALLVHEGKLDWDTPIQQYLPEFGKRTDDIGQKTTLRDLLSMRTGLAVSHASFGQQRAEFLIPRSETVRTAAHLAAVAPFRKQFVYSQWNYSLITDIIEEVTGIPFDVYVKEKLLARLKMDRTHFGEHGEGYNISKAHAIRSDFTSCTILPPGVTNETGFAAAVGCKASLHDILCMYQTFLASYTHQHKEDVDSTPGSPWKYSRKIMEPHVRVGSSDINQLAYCLGLYRIRLPANLSFASLNQQLFGAARIPIPEAGSSKKDLEVYHHAAAVPGFHGSMFMIPSTESAVVVLTNSLPLVDPTDFAAQLLLSVLLDETPLEEEFVEMAEMARPFQLIGYERLAAALDKKKTNVPPSFPLSCYEGDYYNALENLAFSISESGDGLRMTVKGSSRTSYNLLPYDGDTFYWKADRDWELCTKGMWPFMSPEPHKIHFKASDNGHVQQLTWFHDPLGQPETFRKMASSTAKL
ncbi:beta-lactamase/transpeptidase-like protein [Melanomma pulvis-pyrius CBS 109.77]|uniref:Beta-lactamase/transpeptidase-like protein n=1 Tax=Melanomma pulvis-pyrius CBS 109.77 TaxID=1314802 RepID=A0A6A6X4V6_9PLEO|nr:beta-lactamase/transpeptidase-like protein [Melanomma pulvis-pyrius CBS 109.77]